MGSYLQVEITGPLVELEKVKLKKLPTWELNDVVGWDLDEITMSVPSADDTGGYQTLKTGRWHLTLEGNSKWTQEESFSWAADFTAKRPALTVVVRDEWDNRDADEPGVEERVYRGGDFIEAESKQNGEVPFNLHELMDEGKKAIIAWEASLSSPAGTIVAGLRLADAMRALVAGLA